MFIHTNAMGRSAVVGNTSTTAPRGPGVPASTLARRFFFRARTGWSLYTIFQVKSAVRLFRTQSTQSARYTAAWLIFLWKKSTTLPRRRPFRGVSLSGGRAFGSMVRRRRPKKYS